MRKIIFTLSFLISFASADWLLNTTYTCVKSYYVTPATGTLYYVTSHDNATLSSTTKSLIDDLIDGYEYNATSLECSPIPPNNTLSIKNQDYSYLMALTGLLCAFLISIMTITLIKDN